jgi:hypothetical protein
VSAFPCWLDDDAVTIAVEPTGLATASRHLAHVDIDEVQVDGHNIALRLVGGTTVTISQLGRQRDDFLLKFGEARRAARRAALLQWTGDRPIDEYEGRGGDDPLTVTLFADGLTVDGWSAASQVAPFSLIERVEREGYKITVGLRGGLAPVVVRQLGRRTDEFLLDLERARTELVARTAQAYAALSDRLAGFNAPDGWAVTADEAGQWWGALRTAVASSRPAEVDGLEHLADRDMRAGIKAQPDGTSMPFVLAPRGQMVAVEGTHADEARATFVYRTDDIDRLNAALLLTSFRREAISLPEDQLGRWTLAVRTLEIVRWARSALAARVVHDEGWTEKITQALCS